MIKKQGWFRPPTSLGQTIGDFVILKRSNKRHRPHHRGGEYYYIGKCNKCGAEVSKTMWNFRTYKIHC